MANKKISQLTAKGTALAATDLVEISESDGAGGYVTKSVTGANVKSGLQATLVSATNIKTINSTTLLGSGDLAVQATLVSATNIKTINGNTILGSGDLVIAGGGGVHVLTKPVSGRTYSVRTNATTANSSSTAAANNISLYPFIPANSITISNLQLNVAGAVAANIRILVYSDLDGVPSSKLIESTNLDASTTGVKTFTTSYTFTAGTVYWLGCYSSASVSVSALDAAQMTPISTNAFGTAYSSVFASTTFGSAPSTLGTATLSSSTSNLCVINLTAA
jgi:hypothetical protein